MNKEEYNLDSDESDEDFCPDKEAVSDAASVEDTDEEISDDEGANSIEYEVGEKLPRRTNKKRKQQGKKKSVKAVVENNAPSRGTRSGAHLNGDGKDMIEKKELESDEEEKLRTDALWSDFLNDVKTTTTNSQKNGGTSPLEQDNKKEAATSSSSKSTLLNSKAGDLHNSRGCQKVTVPELLDFAGEEVRVPRVVDTGNIKENKSKARLDEAVVFVAKQVAGKKRPAVKSGGLGSVLNTLEKRKKLSVLEKTKLDWTSFKQNEGIEEQLQTFNKGKDGYLERQDFLQRTDVRQFEIEKDFRQSRRNN